HHRGSCPGSSMCSPCTRSCRPIRTWTPPARSTPGCSKAGADTTYHHRWSEDEEVFEAAERTPRTMREQRPAPLLPGDALGQVAWPVHVFALGQGQFVGKHLQRDRRHERLQQR